MRGLKLTRLLRPSYGGSRLDSPIMRLVLCVLATTLQTLARAQAVPPRAIEFQNFTASSGITFVHFKGNNGISINREEFGPGVSRFRL